MKNSNVLEFGDIPQVAMDTMNEVHREELMIVNNIHLAILDNNEEEISLLCKQWLEHTKAHFDRENLMMEKYGFPAYHCHRGEHVEALEVLQTVIQSWNENKDLKVLALYVKDSWPQWYVNHISTMDLVTSAFIKQSMRVENKN
jgi:hemerythrin